MRLHRFYVDPKQERLNHDFWLHDDRIIMQWRKVLRYRVGQEVVLFDGVEHERLYKISEFESDGAHVEYITDMRRQLPKKDVYLAWAMLKKDKNDWVLQKCTELGVNHFVPLLSERCEKTGFNEERARKIIIEAAEQCGRSNIPVLRQPMWAETFIKEIPKTTTIYVCDQSGDPLNSSESPVAILVGPEGGWTDAEKSLFIKAGVKLANIGDFTHRAETASVTALAKLL